MSREDLTNALLWLGCSSRVCPIGSSCINMYDGSVRMCPINLVRSEVSEQ